MTLNNGQLNSCSAIVHHKEPLRGDEILILDPSNFEAVCWQLHSGAIQSEEALGYDRIIGADGWPVDDKYPTSQSK